MSYEIEVRESRAVPTVTIRERTTPVGVGATYRELLPAILEYCARNGIEPAGPPFGIYHTYTDDEVDMEVGVPVAASLEGEGRILASELPGGREAVAIHPGSYRAIAEAHQALDEFVHRESGRHRASPREVYLIGPAEAEDPSEWRTEVIYPMA